MQQFTRQRQVWRDNPDGQTPVMAAHITAWETHMVNASEAVTALETATAGLPGKLDDASNRANAAYDLAAAAMVAATSGGGTTTTPTESLTTVNSQTFDTLDGVVSGGSTTATVSGGNLNVTSGVDVHWTVSPASEGTHYRVTATAAGATTGKVRLKVSAYNAAGWIADAPLVESVAGATSVSLDYTPVTGTTSLVVFVQAVDSTTSWQVADVTTSTVATSSVTTTDPSTAPSGLTDADFVGI